MPIDVLMPPLSQTLDTLVLVEWLKREGDAVRKGEPLFLVESDKATLEVEAPATGVVRALLARPGDEVRIKTPVAVIAAPGEDEPWRAAAALSDLRNPQPTRCWRRRPLARRSRTGTCHAYRREPPCPGARRAGRGGAGGAPPHRPPRDDRRAGRAGISRGGTGTPPRLPGGAAGGGRRRRRPGGAGGEPDPASASSAPTWSPHWRQMSCRKRQLARSQPSDYRPDFGPLCRCQAVSPCLSVASAGSAPSGCRPRTRWSCPSP